MNQIHKTYYAKTEHGNLSLTVAEHCDAVAKLACNYGFKLGCSEEAYLCGLFHDFGKYGDLFQDLLKGRCTKVDHALPGAVMMQGFRQIAEVIAGHHVGLKSYEELESLFSELVRNDCLENVTPEGKVVSVCGTFAFSKAQSSFLKDHPNFHMPGISCLRSGVTWKDKLDYLLDVRMLYSCQVDADYTVSGDIVDSDIVLDSIECLNRLDRYRNHVIVSSSAKSVVNQMRDMVYSNAGLAGIGSASFLTMTAPTGSGKTFAMLKFALERCRADANRKRIIFVLPFLSLCDQVESVCREIFPYVLVDHSQSQDRGENRELSERWDCPCIITTTVQFFQSLWSNRPGDCRKLHRLSDAVILFDEIQALPHSVCRYAMQSLQHLSERYGSCVLLSTATQPAYQYLPEIDWNPYEVIQDVDGLFFMVTRTGMVFEPEPVDLMDIADRALSYLSACVIVNVKRYAREIYQHWQDSGVDHIFLLYTDLCADHRRVILDQIHDLQRFGESVYVVATQCVEAGVDLDFQQVFRQLAPLTSLIQSAGRQNRNGKWPVDNMIVFEPKISAGNKPSYPGPDYEKQAVYVKEMLNSGYDVCSLFGIQEYYRRLFAGYSESNLLSRSLACLDYAGFSKHSALIRTSGCRVVVPYGNLDLFHRIQRSAIDGTVAKKDLRLLSGVSVQCYDRKSVSEHCVQIRIRNYRSGVVYPTDIWALLPGHEVCYDEHFGLKFDSVNVDEFYVL